MPHNSQELVHSNQAPASIQAQPITLQKLLARFIDAQDIATSSRATYARQLQQFHVWLEDTGRIHALHQLQRQDILDFKAYLQQEGRSSYTISGYLTAVRRLFEWLEAEKLYMNVARGVKGAKKAKGFRKDTLTPHQLRDALEAMPKDSLDGLRDYALFNLLVRTGLRTIEVARASVADLRQEAGEAVLWIQGKGRHTKDDFVLLTHETLKPIRAYLAARGPLKDSDALFGSHSTKNYGQALTTRSLSRIVKDALRRVNLDSSRLTAHSLRHTAITLSLKGGATVQQAQAMARHSDPRTTMVYAQNLSRIQDGAERFISF
jgi:integrase/recombinase XerC/integrase/recombinase XerD